MLVPGPIVAHFEKKEKSMDDPLWEYHAALKEQKEKEVSEFLALKKQVEELTTRVKVLEDEKKAEKQYRKDFLRHALP